MVFKSFRLHCILRILLIFITLLLLVYLLQYKQILAGLVILGLLLIYQIVALIRYVEITNIKITRFLDSITYSDFSQSFQIKQHGRTFDELNRAYKIVMQHIQQTRAEKEENYRYLQTVIQNIGLGLIIFRDDDKVDLINNAAKRLLDVRRVKQLNHLCSIDADLPERLRRNKGGEKFIFKMNRDEQLFTYLFFTTDFIQKAHHYRLVTIQNIQVEMEEKEMEAWQNLIRVLTHEIMNSVTPIISLSATANSILSEHGQHDQTEQDEWLSDIHDAVDTIEHRSENLLKFVENYRQLTRLPKPDFEIIPVKQLLDHVIPLFKNDPKSKHITYSCIVKPSGLRITADRNLVEQVLINLFKNAVEVLDNVSKPEISASAGINDLGRTLIKVRDNGPGIEPNVIPKLFIPFFTTKPKGSGIGLSLSRQIMRLHGGSLTVQSHPGESTVFTMIF